MVVHEPTTGATDEWYTPKWVFDKLGLRFDMDVAAAPNAAPSCVPADNHIQTDSLNKIWTGLIWMNPPYGKRNGLVPWMDKFIRHGNGIALVPDRTSAPWFQKAFTMCDVVMFTPKIQFVKPDGSLGPSPSNGSAFMAMGITARTAVVHAAVYDNMGIVCKPLGGIFNAKS